MNILLSICFAICTWTLIIMVIIMVIIGVHEGGHLLACRLVGVDWKYFEVGALRVTREDKRWRISLSKHWAGGLVKPRLTDKRVTRLQLSIIYLGGMASNVLFGTILIAYICSLSAQEQEAQMSFWLALVGGLSIVMGFANLIPMRIRSQGLSSDGLLFYHLLKSHQLFQNYYAQWDRYEAMQQLCARADQGVRPREWDRTQILRAMALQDDSEAEAYAAHNAFYWAADNGDWLIAGHHIERAMALRDKLTDAQRVMILLDTAYY